MSVCQLWVAKLLIRQWQGPDLHRCQVGPDDGCSLGPILIGCELATQPPVLARRQETVIHCSESDKPDIGSGSE